jgi:uncharacterized protein with ATP-grasp and redox domains
MKTQTDCFECIKNQLERVAGEITEDAALRERIISGGMTELARLDTDLPPPYFGQMVHRAVRRISGNPDPYKGFKELFNQSALLIARDLQVMVASSDDPFRTAVLLSLAGNIIDSAVSDRVRLLATIHDTLDRRPVVDHIERLKRSLPGSSTVLFIGDNAGETVMDRLLLEQFPAEVGIVYAVRGGPVINDATLDDAAAAGIGDVAEIIPNGSDAPGTILEDCSTVFIDQFRNADLVIAKGMGNFETLRDHREQEIFFLLLVKCHLVARHLGCAKGDAVVLHKRKGVIV